MKELFHFIFLTLVLTPVVGSINTTYTFAAPNTEMKPETSSQNLKEDINANKNNTLNLETTQSTPTTPYQLNTDNIIINSQSRRKLIGAPALSAQFGFLGGTPQEANQNISAAVMGLEVLNPDRKINPWSIGFKFNSDLNLLFLGVEKSQGLDWPDFYKPYWRYGFGYVLNSDEGLATFLNTRRLHLKLGLGFNDLLDTEQRNSLELGVGIGMTGIFYYLQFGHYFYF